MFLVKISILCFLLYVFIKCEFCCVSEKMAKLVHWSVIHQGNNLSVKVEILGTTVLGLEISKRKIPSDRRERPRVSNLRKAS